MADKTPTRIRIRPVARTCAGCPIADRARHLGLCSLCCSLVTDPEGVLYVAMTPLDSGNGWQDIDAGRLSPVPRALAIE